MPTIGDFVSNREADALEELIELDPDFVEVVSSTVRLQNLDLSTAEQFFGLYTPSEGWRPVHPVESIANLRPRQPLSKKWHTLLEACYELTTQVSILLEAADYIMSETSEGMPLVELGKRNVYHWRSWFIHAIALAERVNGIIGQTTRVYVSEQSERANIAKPYRASVHEQVVTKIKQARNDFLHANRPRWAKGLTDKGLWERNLAAGLTIQRSLEEIAYPKYAIDAKSGESKLVADSTERICLILGNILHDLERAVKDHSTVS